MIDSNVAAAARLYEEPAIGKLEDDVLGAIEAHDSTYTAFVETRNALAPLYARVLSAWLRPGAVIDTHDRTPGKARCLISIKVSSGTARNATKFRIASQPGIEVAADGGPEMTAWRVYATPISPTTGKDMSGGVHGASKGHQYVTLTGYLWCHGFHDLTGDAYRQRERDDFMRMVADAEDILGLRES